MKPKLVESLALRIEAYIRAEETELHQLVDGRRIVTLSDLKLCLADIRLLVLHVARCGQNDGTAVVLKLAMPFVRTDEPPMLFASESVGLVSHICSCLVMIDQSQKAVAVAIYHLNEAICSKFSAKDVFVLLDPVQMPVTVSNADGQQIQYTSLQLDHPSKFFVNGNCMSSRFSHASLSITNLSS